MISPQVENIEGERENNNWITKEWMKSDEWMERRLTFFTSTPAGKEKESSYELIVTMNG